MKLCVVGDAIDDAGIRRVAHRHLNPVLDLTEWNHQQIFQHRTWHHTVIEGIQKINQSGLRNKRHPMLFRKRFKQRALIDETVIYEISPKPRVAFPTRSEAGVELFHRNRPTLDEHFSQQSHDVILQLLQKSFHNPFKSRSFR